MRNRILKFIAVYLLIVVVFITQRPIFFAVYHSLFEGVGIGEFFGAIGHGLPHDLSMAGYLTAIPGLLLIASVWTQASLLKKIERGYFLFAAIVMSMVFITDLALYGYWGFRLDYTPVFYFMSSPADALASVSPWFVAAGVAAIGLYAWGIYRLLRLTERIRLNRVEGTGRRIATGFGCLLLTGVLFLPIRGGLTTATMNPGTVYFSDNQRLNHAAMNPMFSFLYSATHQTNFDKQFRYMDDAKATRLFAAMTDRPIAAADSVPRLFTQQRPNVILVILESFSVHLMPSLGGEDIAPSIDRYAREGVIFSNFYANSFRTDRGLVSIISGYPAQPNTSIMKYTEKVENLPSLSRSMKNAGYDLAYYYGGDGTLNEILQGTVGHPNAAIGCVPCGSGNDYVRNFGTQAQFLDLDAQLAAQPFAADVIRTPQGCGIDIYAAGIDAQVANGIPKWRRVPFCGGTTAYTLSILEAVCSTFRHRLRITADDRQLEDTFMMLAVCNGQQYGGGYCAAPHASMTDGLLDVVLLRPVPRLKLPGLLGSYKKGEHLSEGDTVTEKFAPYMTFFRTGSIDIEVLDGNPLITTLDGECSPQLRMHAEIAHSAARILLPPELAANANKTPVLQAMGE